jgi:phosphopantetheine--protein transferase-like protein
MKATSNSEAETEAGRLPAEMSRPATSTRSGFMESQGAGVQILMAADLAVKMGVPIYGIVGHVATATDKNGRSVPAPGKGLLVTARQQHALIPSPILDIGYRRKHLEDELAKVDEWYKSELEFLAKWITEQAARNGLSEQQAKTMAAEQAESLELKHRHKRSVALAVWGNEFYRGDPYISPLTGGLAVWGLTIDDVEVASFHGTGTAANDTNESQLLQKQLEHLGRSTGNCILSIFQKYLTGHPKGAAAAWMLNGLLQSMMTGIVPGNRNADNIDKELEACDHIVFLNRSLHTYGFKAGLLKSFGFGQVGGEILVIHPDYLMAQLSPEELDAYARLRQRRYNLAYRHWHDSLTQRKSFVMLKDHAPYTYSEEQKVYLDPKARAAFDGVSWSFPQTDRRKLYTKGSSGGAPASPTRGGRSGSSIGSSTPRIKSSARTNLEVTLREMGEGLRAPNDRGIGVDTQLISEIEVSISNSTNFLSRNFTPDEVNYCRSTGDPAASFAGRWAAKEAVVKAISSCDDNERSRELWEGGGAALRDIEILRGPSGAPKVVLHGHANTVASVLGINAIKVTISHSGEYAIAQAIAQ